MPRKARKFVLWKNGVYEKNGTAAELAEELCTSASYIAVSCRDGHILFGEYQISESRDKKPQKAPDGRAGRAVTYQLVREDGQVTASGTAQELAERCQVSPHTIRSDAVSGYRLMGMWKVERTGES